MKKYYTELYFYQNKSENKGLSDKPDLDKYSKSVIAYDLSANSWESAKKRILDKYPDIAYIYVVDSKNLDI